MGIPILKNNDVETISRNEPTTMTGSGIVKNLERGVYIEDDKERYVYHMGT